MVDMILGGFLILCAVAVAGIVLYGAYILLKWLYAIIFFSYSYGPVQEMKGTVIDMRYTAPRTTMAGKTPIHHPEKNEVFIRDEDGWDWTLNSDSLYQRVRIDEEVIMDYQEEYAKPRFWHGDWKYNTDRLLAITNVKGRTVEWKSEKPVTHHSGRRRAR